MIQSDFFRCFCQQTLILYLKPGLTQGSRVDPVPIIKFSFCLPLPTCVEVYLFFFIQEEFFFFSWPFLLFEHLGYFQFFVFRTASPSFSYTRNPSQLLSPLRNIFLFCSEVVHVSESRVKSTFYKQKIHPISILNRNFSFYTAQRAHTFFFHVLFLEVFSLY